MKKLTKLSLVAGLALASISTANASDLKDAFANGKFSGEIKAMYFDETQETGNDEGQITAVGGKLSFETGTVADFYAKATFQTSHIVDYNDKNGNVFEKDMDASGSVLSESYIGYKSKTFFGKFGRQFIKTPLLANSGSRMIKDSFEAYILGTTIVPGTTIVAGYADKYANRTDKAGSTGEFNEISKDGAYTLYLANESIDNLKLQAQYATVQDTDNLSIMYADAAYKLGGTKLAVQYGISDNDANTDKGSLFGIKVDQKIADLTLIGAYNKAGNDEDYASGLGEGAHYAFTKLTVGSGKKAYKATADSFMVKAAYKLADLSVGAAYAKYETDANDEYIEQEITASYKFNKEAYLKLSHSMFEGDSDSGNYETRLTLGYKF